MIKLQSITFHGPAGRLEGVVKADDSVDPKALAVVCHPHPLYQGTMHNKVVFATAEAFFGLGCKVLRFNFRGAGLSSGSHDYGRGEVEDVLAAVNFLQNQHSELRCHVSGFSFGAWMAIEAAARETRLASLTAVAVPFRRFDSSLLTELFNPKLFLQGTADELCPASELQQLFPSFAEPKEIVMFEGAGHFFDNHLTDLKNAIVTHKAFLGL
jgi:uncharacterized protein